LAPVLSHGAALFRFGTPGLVSGQRGHASRQPATRASPSPGVSPWSVPLDAMVQSYAGLIDDLELPRAALVDSRLLEPCVFEIELANSFDLLSDEYRTLFEGSRATAFQHPLWLDRLYRGLVPRRKAEPLIIAVRWSNDQRLAMILPLVRRRYGLVR